MLLHGAFNTHHDLYHNTNLCTAYTGKVCISLGVSGVADTISCPSDLKVSKVCIKTLMQEALTSETFFVALGFDFYAMQTLGVSCWLNTRL